jgi:hypothetical protein
MVVTSLAGERLNIIECIGCIGCRETSTCFYILKYFKQNYSVSESGFLDFVHRLYFNEITTFWKLDLLLSSGKKGEDRNPSCWAPWLS